jgi:hypothetical protein
MFTVGLAALLLDVLRMAPAQSAERGQAASTVMSGRWMPVSDGVLQNLTAEGKKPAWPGETAGVSVDRATGEVSMIVPDQGLWKSRDRGTSFVRVDGGSIGGRCETGFALNSDPAGGRLACFMLDGQSAITLDNGKTWRAFQPHGRGWDFGAVDWEQRDPQTILAIHHEADGELCLSADGGRSWKALDKDYVAIGVFNATALVASKGEGILRSVDGGATWTRVSDHTPTGRVMTVYKGIGYWLTQEGLLVSKDRGATWQLQGGPIKAAWGPYFGRDEKQIVVVGQLGGDTGFWRSHDAGRTWLQVAPLPDFGRETPPGWTLTKYFSAGWFYNYGWDPRADLLYASRMGHPTFQYRRP